MRMFKKETDPFSSSQKKKTDGKKVLWEFANHHEQGLRPTMEDAVAIKEQFSECSYNILLAVFDGHSGGRCSQFLKDSLPEEIIKHPNLGKDNTLTMEALKDAFFASESKWLSQAREKKWEDGSTALCALVLNNVLFVANTGDCRALMCKGGTNVTLTRDHKPDEPEERTRIESRGGNIIGGRVQGQLGVSRSFGDYLYKDKENLIENYLNCEPEISSFILTPDTDFIVIGCDGLYDEMSNDDIVNFVKTKMEEKKSTSEICKELVQEAIERGSKDNVSAIILKFDKYFKKKLQLAMKLKDNEKKVSLNKTTEIRKDNSDKKKEEDAYSDEAKLKPYKRNTQTSSKSRSGSEEHKSSSTAESAPSSDESTTGKTKRSSIEPTNNKVKFNKQEQKSNSDSKRVLPASLSSEIQNFKRQKSPSVDLERKKVINPLTNSVNNISKKSKEKSQEKSQEKESIPKKKNSKKSRSGSTKIDRQILEKQVFIEKQTTPEKQITPEKQSTEKQKPDKQTPEIVEKKKQSSEKQSIEKQKQSSEKQTTDKQKT